MARRIVIIQGHPDGSAGHFCHALASAYEDSARTAGHEIRRIDVAALDIAPLRSRTQWQEGEPPEAVAQAQKTIEWAEHLVIFYPLWLGSMPSLLKAFFEQVFRPGFAVDRGGSELVWHKRLSGRSARIVITMGMPVFVYRFYFLSHSLKTLERNILGFCGIRPVQASLVGLVDAPDPAARNRWLQKMARLGYKGD